MAVRFLSDGSQTDENVTWRMLTRFSETLLEIEVDLNYSA
jgi:hypothetical protein